MGLFDWLRGRPEVPGIIGDEFEQWYTVGYTAYEHDQLHLALDCAEKATNIRPRDVRGWEMLGCILGNLGRFEESLRAFEMLRDLDHGCINCWRNTFIACGELGRASEKGLSFTRAVGLLAAPSLGSTDVPLLRQCAQNLLDLAGMFRRDNRPDEMEQVYRVAIGMIAAAASADATPGTAHMEASMWFNLGQDLRTMQRLDSAEGAIRVALRRWQRLQIQAPDDPRYRSGRAGAFNVLGLIGYETGRDSSAEAAHREAVALREAGVLANPLDHENQLYLGGALCNLGNIHRERGQAAYARDCYTRAIGIIESVQTSLAGNVLVSQFLGNCRGALRECTSPDSQGDGSLPLVCIHTTRSGPPALTLETPNASLASALRAADGLRLAGDASAEHATADLVTMFPDCADAWLLRGLVLGRFWTEEGGDVIRWDDDRHQEAISAFHEALACQPDCYQAKLYKGLAFMQSAMVAANRLMVLHEPKQSILESERQRLEASTTRRLKCDVARARESLEAAARLRPSEGRIWYELACLYNRLGERHETGPFLERLRAVDPSLWSAARAEFSEQQSE